MGVSLSGLVHGEPVSFEDLKGRTIAIDAYNTLYQFLATIRDRFTGEPLRDSTGRITSHLSGLFYRTARLIEAGITPVFVFDGEPPAFKRHTIEQRIAVRKVAEEKWKDAVATGDVEKVRTYAQGATRLTKEMVQEAHTLLELMGVSWLQAPSEGEAQAAHLLAAGQAWAVGSQDWDSLLFGADRVVRNLAITGKRKVAGKQAQIDVQPELVTLERALQGLEITREQLVILGILVGTDYNPGGVKGIGPKTALKLVKEHETLDQVLAHVAWPFEIPARQIYDFFLHPPAVDLPIEKRRLDPSGLVAFLGGEHGFSRERIEAVTKKLETAKKQPGLGGFFRT